MLPARRVARAIAATRGDAPGTRPPISALARGFASSDASGPEVVDVCVVGGGVVGTAMACLLRASPRTKHLSVTLVDRAAPPPPSLLDAPPAVADARVSALTPASVALLRSVGAWDRVAAARARPFTAMQVWDARAPGHVRYDASELGADALGYVVENRIVHAALAEAANRLGVVAAAPSGVEGVLCGPTLPGPFSVVTLRRVGDAKEEESSTTTTSLHARVVVGEVDEAVRGVGKYDFSRPSKAGDAETFPSRVSGKDALVDVERLVVSSFLEPLTKRGMSMLEQAHRNGGLGAGVGLVGGAPFETPPRVTGAGGTRGAFPLATRMAGRHVSSRLALIGDAAHQVHPLGGQGVNLGLRDAQLLQGVFEETCAVGGDVGSSSCLLAYEKKARAANAPMMAALDALQKLFAVDSAGVAWARGFGLAGVNAIGPLRREIAKYAMGGA